MNDKYTKKEIADKALSCCIRDKCKECPYYQNGEKDKSYLQIYCDCTQGIVRNNYLDAFVHPEPSSEMTYVTNCRCNICGVQLIREDNYCRHCGRIIIWQQ